MNNVQDYIDSHILEEVRRTSKKIALNRKIFIGCIATIPICIAAIVLIHNVFYYYEEAAAIFFLLPFPCTFYIVFVSPKTASKLHDKQKYLLWDYAVNDILKKFFEVSEYDRNSHISNAIVSKSNIVGGYDYDYGSDHLKGHYRSKYFEFSEKWFTRLEYHTGEGGGGHYQANFFSGPWFVVQFSRLLSGRLLIRENNKSQKIIGNIGNLKKTATGNAEFDKRFSVYTNDESVLSYILTPDFITAILEKGKVVGSFMHISLEGGRLYLGFKKAKLFSGNLTDEELNSVQKIKERYTAELRGYTDLIDLFIDSGKLDN